MVYTGDMSQFRLLKGGQYIGLAYIGRTLKAVHGISAMQAAK